MNIFSSYNVFCKQTQTEYIAYSVENVYVNMVKYYCISWNHLLLNGSALAIHIQILKWCTGNWNSYETVNT